MRLIFASDYPRYLTGVNTDTGNGMVALKNYIDAVRDLPLRRRVKMRCLAALAAALLRL